MPKLTPTQLRAIVRSEYADKRRLGELISGIKVHSKTKVSLWLSSKYKGDTETLERDIRFFLMRSPLSRRDEQRLLAIRELLNDADNRDAIIAQITAAIEQW